VSVSVAVPLAKRVLTVPRGVTSVVGGSSLGGTCPVTEHKSAGFPYIPPGQSCVQATLPQLKETKSNPTIIHFTLFIYNTSR
jgi:hypothetical protein